MLSNFGKVGRICGGRSLLLRKNPSSLRSHYSTSRPLSQLFSRGHVIGSNSNLPRGEQIPVAVLNPSRQYSNDVKRAFPSYYVYGDNCILHIKPIMPKFKSVTQDGISLQEKGRMLLELAPAKTGNQRGFNWEEKISFALTVEEMGLMLSQLPHYRVAFGRKIGGNNSTGFNGAGYDLVSAPVSNESIDKVLIADPDDGATITFRLDFQKEGVGGQFPPPGTNEGCRSAPLEATIEAGEWEVIKTLFRESIPRFLGWSKMMDIELSSAVDMAKKPM